MTPVERLGIVAAAKRCGLSPSTLRRYVKAGRLAAELTPAGQLRFRPEDIDQLYQPAPTGSVSLPLYAQQLRGERA